MLHWLFSLLRSWLGMDVEGTSVPTVVPLTVAPSFGNWGYQLIEMAAEQRAATMRVALGQLVRDAPTDWFMDDITLVPLCDAEHMANSRRVT
jgi:hypothetical protein